METPRNKEKGGPSTGFFNAGVTILLLLHGIADKLDIGKHCAKIVQKIHDIQIENEMTTKVERKMPNGETAIFYKHDGFTFKSDMVEKMMDAKDLDLQLKGIKETPIRDDDVILCAFPKTGTHWTWEIINMVQRGAAEYQKDTKGVAMLDFCSQEMTASMTSPRVLNTHLTHNLIPAGIKEKKCKIIHVMRNPKDVVVSFYFHLRNMVGADKSPPFEMFMKSFRGALGDPLHCSYTWYLKHWEQFQTENPDYPLLNVYYEDMKKNPEQAIRRIEKFLRKEISDDTIKEISTKCNFQNMKEAHTQKNDVNKGKVGKGTAFLYRKGGIGDWKNHLTVAESAEFDNWIETELKDSKIKFQYE